MTQIAQKGRLLFAVGAGLFGVALAAGVGQSLRTDGKLPAIDLIKNGSGAYINLLIGREDHDGAIEELQMQSRLVPPDAETHLLLGKLLGSRSRPEEARVHFQALVKLRPRDAEALCLLGSTYLDTNQPEQAIPCFTEALGINPQSAIAYNGLGAALGQLGNMAEAEKSFARAVELSPNFTQAQVNLEKARQALRSGKGSAGP